MANYLATNCIGLIGSKAAYELINDPKFMKAYLEYQLNEVDDRIAALEADRVAKHLRPYKYSCEVNGITIATPHLDMELLRDKREYLQRVLDICRVEEKVREQVEQNA